MPVQIENWSLLGPSLGFTSMWRNACGLHGVVTGHPKITDGHHALTSYLVEFNFQTKTAKTRTGTEYSLGSLSPEYDKWLDEAEDVS